MSPIDPTSARRRSGIASQGCCGADLAVDIIEWEIRSALQEVWLEASELVLTGEPIEIARQMRARAERTPRPPKMKST